MAQVFRGDDLATIEFCGSKRALWAQSDRMSAGGTLEELWKSGRQGNLWPEENASAYRTSFPSCRFLLTLLLMGFPAKSKQLIEGRVVPFHRSTLCRMKEVPEAQREPGPNSLGRHGQSIGFAAEARLRLDCRWAPA